MKKSALSTSFIGVIINSFESAITLFVQASPCEKANKLNAKRIKLLQARVSSSGSEEN
ncbi:hypothetical protein [Cytobacillus firmus]|uniref:hypothetical protein n=1 Tax=Cytobacillus firmus TaxID=1399 RepID=UPI001C8E6F1B|nr:hypothetical protein [Cytobacillus firmus]MBX9973956.1 hypothetical protein [Cytobacillus firmus]